MASVVRVTMLPRKRALSHWGQRLRSDFQNDPHTAIDRRAIDVGDGVRIVCNNVDGHARGEY